VSIGTEVGVAPIAPGNRRDTVVTSSIIRMVEEDIERPNHGPDSAEGAIAGAPIESAHEYYSQDGHTSGVWVCSPGRMLEEQHAEDEFCTIVSGKVGLVDNENGLEEVFVAGDSFFLPKGSSLTWVVYETVRKFYMTAE
jgi:uncharacterized cupin superfamily protein